MIKLETHPHSDEEDDGMKTLEHYLDSKFAALPDTAETRRTKTDLLAKMTTRYDELLGLGKNENEALGTVISEFDSVESLFEGITPTNAPPGDEMTQSEAEAFWRSTKRLAMAIAGGILSIAIGAGLMVALLPTSLNWLGVLLLIFGLIIGISAFIVVGLAHVRVKVPLDKRVLSTQIKVLAKNRQQDYSSSFTIALVGGVALCLFALFPPILQTIWSAESFGLLSVAAFIWILGSGLFAIVYGSMVYAGYSRLARADVFYAVTDPDDRMLAELKQRNPKLHGFLYQLYWPLVFVAYLLFSFVFGFWTLSWLIFPIAGVLFAGIRNYALQIPKG